MASFTVDQALDLGVTIGRLRGDDLVAPSRSLRRRSTTQPDPLADARSLLALHGDAVVSHQTAALWWQLPLPLRLAGDRRVHLSLSATDGATPHIRRRGVVAHRTRLPPEDVRRVGRWTVSTPERTFLDLAPLLAEDELVILGDAIVCAHPGGRPSTRRTLSTPERLVERCADAHVRGVRAARAALALVRVGSDSAPETQLRLDLVRAGLPEPALNVVLVAPGGRRPVFPDLAFRRHRVSVQYDGAHHADPHQHRLDIERADLTAAAGWVEVRISADDLRVQVRHRSGPASRAVVKIEAALRAQAARLG
ncbi:hypothetical protein [Tersicoccus sp. Bi-70]|uniref:hypothetical protein n=1 Tax=Tersicoccus sp. Bi-70 TaxID=1897634 RepID=UPI000975CD24|nr:hypothetical protein [Tersicoccus sp. Bi-70]OMH34459.1 hypothetical protein BGP79_05035 [Tersicoccus sp. Bi-70]